MSDKLGYVVLEVGGIQKYILSTGKLKEMIGGSELIESLSDNYLTDFANNNGLTVLDKIRKPEDNEILPLQRNAGAMHLLFSSLEKGKEFLNKFGLQILEDFPGLPIFGASEECEFDSLGIRNAKFELSNKITEWYVENGDTRTLANLHVLQSKLNHPRQQLSLKSFHKQTFRSHSHEGSQIHSR